MKNPWRALPKAPRYVLADDFAALKEFNFKTRDKDARFRFDLVPEPYFGSKNAPVVVLTLNPGVSSADRKIHAKSWFVEKARKSLDHSLRPYPFLHLQPDAPCTPGEKWWRRISRELLENKKVGFDAVAKGLLCIQYIPYHSKKFGSRSLKVPSQEYSFFLLRRALNRGALVIVTRSWKRWIDSVPELEHYKLRFTARNPRNPTLSVRNLGDEAFEAVCKRLQKVSR